MEILLLSGKKIQVLQYSFFLSKKLQQQTLITKTAFSTFYVQDSQWATKWAKIFFQGHCPRTPGGLSISAMAWVCRPKPWLHGPSLRKSLIKNHATLFQVRSSCQLNQTQLDSTKPNTQFFVSLILVLLHKN